MIKSILFIFLLFIPSLFFGQGYVGFKKNKILKNFSNLRTIITETGQTVTMLIRDSAFKQADFVFEFNKNNRCVKSTYTTFCDTCFIDYLKILEIKKFKWFQVNETTFYSSRFWGVQLEIDKVKSFTIMVSKFLLSKRQFDALKRESILYKTINKL